MAKDVPLYKSNFELFRSYLLSVHSDTRMIIKGLTPEDEIFAMEINTHVLVSLFLDSVASLSKSKETNFAIIKRHIKRVASVFNADKRLRLSKSRLPLFERDTKLFEKYVLQLIFTPHNKGEEKIKGVTLKDRRLRVRIILQFLSKELLKVNAKKTKRDITILQAEFDQKVAKIQQAYSRLFSFESHN